MALGALGKLLGVAGARRGDSVAAVSLERKDEVNR